MRLLLLASDEIPGIGVRAMLGCSIFFSGKKYNRTLCRIPKAGEMGLTLSDFRTRAQIWG